jgi:hypothetical protein
MDLRNIWILTSPGSLLLDDWARFLASEVIPLAIQPQNNAKATLLLSNKGKHYAFQKKIND